MAKPKRIWDNYKELFEVQKSDKIKFVVAAATRDGVRYINIREFYMRMRDGVWKPGRDGITIPLNVPIEQGSKILAVASELLMRINEAADVAAEMELVDEANAVWYPAKEDAE